MSLKPCRKIVFVFCIHHKNAKFSVVLDCLVFWSQSFVDNWVLKSFLWSTNTQKTTIRLFIYIFVIGTLTSLLEIERLSKDLIKKMSIELL